MSQSYAPTPEFTAQAIGQAELYDEAAADHEGFWARQARERITWASFRSAWRRANL